MNGFGAFTEAEVEIDLQLEVTHPNLFDSLAVTSTSTAIGQPFVPFKDQWWQNRWDGISGSPYQFTQASGKIASARRLSSTEDVWKEISTQMYVGEPTVVMMRLKRTSVHTYQANRGIKIDDVVFRIIRRSGNAPTRY
jgi:hypothetical protein